MSKLDSFVTGLASGLVISDTAKPFKKAKVKKNPPSSVLPIAAAMFLIGLLKGRLSAAGMCHCPDCAESNAREAKKLSSPLHVVNLVALVPVAEENLFRGNLAPLAGPAAASAAFGLGHMSKDMNARQNAWRAAEAALAGFLVYQPVFDSAGLLGAAAVHAAHNAGAVLARKQALKRAGYLR